MIGGSDLFKGGTICRKSSGKEKPRERQLLGGRQGGDGRESWTAVTHIFEGDSLAAKRGKGEER